jgi:site-specific DNA recombinase
MDQAQKIDWSVWKLIRDHYDAGGYSGGTMKRPALHRLLEVIGAGRIAP